MKKALWNEKKKEVMMGHGEFMELGGSPAFWKKLYDRQEAAKVEDLRALDQLRRSEREACGVDRYDPVAAAERAPHHAAELLRVTRLRALVTGPVARLAYLGTAAGVAVCVATSLVR